MKLILCYTCIYALNIFDLSVRLVVCPRLCKNETQNCPDNITKQAPATISLLKCNYATISKRFLALLHTINGFGSSHSHESKKKTLLISKY